MASVTFIWPRVRTLGDVVCLGGGCCLPLCLAGGVTSSRSVVPRVRTPLVLVQAWPLRWFFCSLVSLAFPRRASGQSSLRPLLKSRVHWYYLSQGAPGATFMPLPALPDVLLSLSCSYYMGPKAARRREPWGSTSARPMTALLVYGWWGGALFY